MELAGALYNALEPAFSVIGTVAGVAIAAVAQLTEHLALLVNGITQVVDFVAFWNDGQEKASTSAENVTKSVGEATAALTTNATAVEQNTAKLTDLQTELESVNQQLDTKRQRYEDLIEKGANPAHASLQQLQRQITALEADQARLNTEIAKTTDQLTETQPAADTAAQATENVSLAIARLQAAAEDARDTLSNTIDFQKLGNNYQAAIAASDEYYDRHIANAQEALSQAEANSDEYFKIETDLFNLQREQEAARKKLTEAASAVARTEADRRIEIATEEKEQLQKAGEETARALAASQKQQTQAAEAEQKRLTEVHEDNLKAREEADRATNERILQNSEEQLSALSEAFENALPESVDTAYQNIQQATLHHYETLKDQARQRITDEDALTAEIISLDRQRNAELQENHRDFIKRIADDAKTLLGERTDAFKTASDDILHNWERTVSEFERQLREADTEDALRQIESDFEAGQQQMLASLEAVLTELGFTAEQAAEIMKDVYRTAEGEADSFADKVISAFKRLGKEADRETKKQNRDIEKSYRALVGEVESVLQGITDVFIQIAQGDSLEGAFRDLGERLGTSVLDTFNEIAADGITEALLGIAEENVGAAAGTGAAARTASTGGSLASIGSISSLTALITSPVVLAAIIPAAVGAATYYVGRQLVDGTRVGTDRLGRDLDTLDDERATRRRRGESQTAYENRLRTRGDAQAAIAERDTFFGNYDPRAPFGRAIQETGIFTGNSGYFAEATLRQTDVDIFGNIDLPGLVENLEGILQTRVEGLGEEMERTGAALNTAADVDLKPTLDAYFTATTDFYQTQIDFANFIRRTTGNLSYGDVESLSSDLQDALNQARLQDTRTNLTQFGIQRNRRDAQATAERTGTDRQFTEDIASAQYGQTAYDAEVLAAGETEDIEKAFAAAKQVEERIADSTRTKAIQAATETLRGMIRDGQSLDDLLAYIQTTLVPLWEQLYQDLIDDLVEQGKTLQQATELVQAEHGTQAEFTRSQTDAIIDPITQKNEETAKQVAEQISDSTRNRAIRDATETLNGMIKAGESVTDLRAYIETHFIPLWEADYNDRIDDLVAQGHTLEDAKALIQAEHGTLSEYTGDKTSALIDPITQKNEETAKAVAERISESQRNRDIREATDTLNEMIQAGTSVNDLRTYIETTLIPLWGQTYQSMIDDLVEQGYTLDDAKALVQAEHGTLSEYTGDKTSAILDPITEKNEETAKQVAERIADSTRNRAIRTATQTLNGMIETGQSVDDLRAYIQTTLIPLWEQAYQDLIDDLVEQGHTLDDAIALVQAEHGTETEFTGEKTANIIDPIIKANQDKAEAAAERTQEKTRQAAERTQERARQVTERISDSTRTQDIRTANETLNGMIKEGQSIDTLLAYINTSLIPLWGKAYQDLIDDLVAQEYTLEQARNVVAAEHGTQSEYTAQKTADILDPITQKNEETAKAVTERIADSTRNRDIRTATETLNHMIKAGTSVDDLRAYIHTSLIPLWEQQYQDLIDDLVEQGYTLDQATHLVQAEHGTSSEFTGGKTSAILDPITTANQEKADAIAEQISDNLLSGDIRTANEGLQDLMKAGASVANLQAYITKTLVPLWEQQYQDMVDDLVEQGYTLDQATAIVDSQHGSQDTFIQTNTDAIINPVTTANQEKAKAVAERISDSTRNRSIRTATETLNDMIKAGQSVEDLRAFIQTTLIPLWEQAYQDLIDDLVAQGYALDDATALIAAEHGTQAEYTRGKTSAIINPITTANQEKANRIATESPSTFAQNRLNRAQFSLSGATSESDFETRRQAVIQAINAYYDAEEARIDGLELSEDELRDLREDNQLQREQALRQINEATNKFAEERIKKAEDVQEKIKDLRDDELENEADRQAKLIELAEDTARRKLEIEEEFHRELDDLQRNRNQTVEDIEQAFTRDLEDILRKAGVSETLFSHGDFQTFRRLAQAPSANPEELRAIASRYDADLDERALEGLRDTAVTRLRDQEDLNRDFGILTPGTGGYKFYRQQIQSGELTDENLIERFFGRRGLDTFVEQQHATEDLAQRTENREAEINANAKAIATAINAALQPLLLQQESIAEQEGTAEKESQTATKQEGTAEKESQTATKQEGTAEKESQTATKQEGTAEKESQTATKQEGTAEKHQTLLELEAANIKAFDTAIKDFRDVSRDMLRRTQPQQELRDISQLDKAHARAFTPGIASGEPWDPYADRLTMGEGLTPGEEAANYAASFGRFQRDPLNFLADQEGYDRGLTAEEGIRKLTDGTGTRIADVVQGLLAYQNTKDERLLALLRPLARPFGSSIENQTLATLFRNAELAYLQEPYQSPALFHFEQTDAIARELARSETMKLMRAERSNPLPTPAQLRNAHDVGREVVSGTLHSFRQHDMTVMSQLANPLTVAITQLSEAIKGAKHPESLLNDETGATLNVRVYLDGKTLVTPEFANRVSDQQSMNDQNYLGIR